MVFEYPCYEEHDSADAPLWYRSHQQVTLVKCVNAADHGGTPPDERFESGQQRVYAIRFFVHLVSDAFEYELLDGAESYQRGQYVVEASDNADRDFNCETRNADWHVEDAEGLHH